MIISYWHIAIAQRVDLDTLANNIGEPNLHHHLQCFLQDQLKLDTSSSSPFFYIPDKILVYSSMVATLYAPSDLCGTGGMCHEQMHAVTSWQCGRPWYDCDFINTDESEPGMHGLSIAWARLFFSATVNCLKYPCALVHWYSPVGDPLDESTGMWAVEPDTLDDGKPWMAIIHLDTVVQLAHLLPIYGEEQAPRGVKYTSSLDVFSADHHASEIAF